MISQWMMPIMLALGILLGWACAVAQRRVVTQHPVRKLQSMHAALEAAVGDAAERWRRANAESRAAGCPTCGQPNTHVRRFRGTIGGVPAEYWTCADHVGEDDPASLPWQIGGVTSVLDR